MSNIKFFLFLVLSGFVEISFGQSYQQLPTGRTLEGAQSYILPKAAWQIELYKVTKEYKKGAQWNNCYSDAELKILEKKYGVDPDIYAKIKADGSGKYTINEISEDSLKLTLIPIPDMTKIFYHYPKKKWNASQGTTFTYGNDGILTDADASYENRTFDIVIKGLAGLASIAGAFKGPSSAFIKPSVTIEDLDKILVSYIKLETQNNYDVYKDLKATLEKQYSKVFSEYFYSSKTKSTPAKLIYCPSIKVAYGATTSIDLFELDNSGKLFYDKALGSDVVWAKNITISSGNLSKPYKLTFNLLDQAHQQIEVIGNALPSNSYFGYNVPAKTIVSIKDPTQKELHLELYKIPQFGKVAYISAKKMNVVFQLDPVSGELKKLSITRKAITDDQVGNTAAAITSAISASKGDDADTKLEKEVKRLENENKRRDLLKELENQ